MARPLVRPMIGTRLRPNHLTTLRLLSGLAACACFASGGRTAIIWGGGLWLVSAFLDRADGELARLGKLMSPGGHRYDYYTDTLINALFFGATGIGLRHSWLGLWSVPLGLIAAVSMMLCGIFSERLERLSPPGTRTYAGRFGFDPDDALYLMGPLAWLGWLSPVLIGAAVCASIIMVIIAVRLRRITNNSANATAQVTPPESLAGAPHAVILAAGVGRRLGPQNDAAPKVMLAFDGASLLARHLRILRQVGVAQVSLVIGYQADQIRAALPGLSEGLTVHTIENPDFREGSVVSLWAAREVLRSGAAIILMDGDVLYDHRLMARLVTGRRSDLMLLDRAIEPGDEPVKLCIRDGNIVDFRKQPTEPHDFHGESVGFFRFTPQTAAELADRADAYVTSGRRDSEYEEPIRDMVMQTAPDRFGFEDITGLPWTEIDFPEDVVKATALLRELVN
jgi:choline kinase/phosphatidylglycerophosphate synthase